MIVIKELPTYLEKYFKTIWGFECAFELQRDFQSYYVIRDASGLYSLPGDHYTLSSKLKLLWASSRFDTAFRLTFTTEI